MIFMTPGQTLQCEASAATSLCVCVYAKVTPLSSPDSWSYQRVGFSALTGAATVDTVVTCPQGYNYEVININVANSNASNRAVRAWHVDSGDAAGTDNFIAYDAPVPGNGALTINKDGISA